MFFWGVVVVSARQWVQKQRNDQILDQHTWSALARPGDKANAAQAWSRKCLLKTEKLATAIPVSKSLVWGGDCKKGSLDLLHKANALPLSQEKVFLCACHQVSVLWRLKVSTNTPTWRSSRGRCRTPGGGRRWSRSRWSRLSHCNTHLSLSHCNTHLTLPHCNTHLTLSHWYTYLSLPCCTTHFSLSSLNLSHCNTCLSHCNTSHYHNVTHI